MTRLRQIVDRAQHRLLFVPLVCVVIAIVLSQATLQIDARLDQTQLPQVMRTTVDSARSILSSIAGGLIASVTLLLSLMLVAVQLASSQFSPRTVRDWIGDRVQQSAIGVVLGTVVYCLLILRETRTFSEGDALTPHVSVIVAVVLGIVSLIAVVRSVDHLTDRLRVGSVAEKIVAQTIKIIEANDQISATEQPAGPSDTANPAPENSTPVTAEAAGWIQQIDTNAILDAAPAASTVYLATGVGSFSLPDAPLAWVWPCPPDDDPCLRSIQRSIAIGDSRTMQQDVSFGILQMVDIALRALSPGVNDPNTANDMVVNLGVVMLKLWERPVAPTIRERDGRTVVLRHIDHGDYLHAAFDPIRIYGANDPHVAMTMVRTLESLRLETTRRELPGPMTPLDEVAAQILAAVERSGLSDYDKQLVRKACSYG